MASFSIRVSRWLFFCVRFMLLSLEIGCWFQFQHTRNILLSKGEKVFLIFNSTVANCRGSRDILQIQLIEFDLCF